MKKTLIVILVLLSVLAVFSVIYAEKSIGIDDVPVIDSGRIIADPGETEQEPPTGDDEDGSSEEPEENVINVIVTIVGSQDSVDYDGEKHNVKGFEITNIDCEVSNNDDLEKCQNYSKKDFEFTGNDKAERKDPGKTWMGLESEQFINKNPEMTSVTFIIVDGYIEINEIEEDYEDPEPEEEPSEDPVVDSDNGEDDENDGGILIINLDDPEDPVDEEPVEEEPVEEEPVEEEPVEEEPVEEEPVEEEPVEEEPVEEEPVEEEPVEEEPVEEEPVEEEPVEEEPVEEEPVEEEPVEEEPVEEEPVEEEPVEGEPVEEEPVEGEPEYETMVLKSGTNIRAEADGLSAILVTLEEDTEVFVISVEGDWTQVQLPDKTIGWVFPGDVDGGDEETPEEPADPELPEPDPITEPEPTEPEPEPVEKKVTIFTSRRTQMEVGEEITLTSLLEGFEDCSQIKYQWECDKGSGFEEIEGANNDSYQYAASEESMGWTWRLVVLYK